MRSSSWRPGSVSYTHLIPYGYLTPGHYLLDLVYNPPLTRFLDLGRQRGARILLSLIHILLRVRRSFHALRRIEEM